MKNTNNNKTSNLGNIIYNVDDYQIEDQNYYVRVNSNPIFETPKIEDLTDYSLVDVHERLNIWNNNSPIFTEIVNDDYCETETEKSEHLELFEGLQFRMAQICSAFQIGYLNLSDLVIISPDKHLIDVNEELNSKFDLQRAEIRFRQVFLIKKGAVRINENFEINYAQYQVKNDLDTLLFNVESYEGDKFGRTQYFTLEFTFNQLFDHTNILDLIKAKPIVSYKIEM